MNTKLHRTPILASLVGGLALATASVVFAQSSSGGQDTSSSQPASQAAPAVTIDDLNTAKEAAASCMNASGITAEIDPGKGLRPHNLRYRIPATNGDSGPPDPTVMAAAQACIEQHINPVEGPYLEAKGSPTVADIDAMFAFLESCIANGGIPGTDLPDTFGSTSYEGYSLQVRTDQVTAYHECALESEALTGLLPPSPGNQ